MDEDIFRPMIVDGHEDLAYNMLTFGRDYTRLVVETRRLEKGTEVPNQNGDTLLGWPEYQEGRVALIFATLFAAPERRKLGVWDTQIYTDPEQAHRVYRVQLDTYHRLVETHPQKFRLVLNCAALEDHLAAWEQSDVALPVGLIPLMENAEGVRSPHELAEWWDAGVRIIGPAWTGTRFCGGTREPGPLTQEGYALLSGMAEFGFILDISHMDEAAVLEALDFYPGTIIASHSNALALLKGAETNRHLSDRVLTGLLERGAVIGVVPANGFLLPGWKDRGGRDAVSLDLVAAQIDYMCQKAGDALHVALGTDFDGGFGLQSMPYDLNTIADIHKLSPFLLARGYSHTDILAIFSGNWIRMLQSSLP
jgi:membrane dipeptidase